MICSIAIFQTTPVAVAGIVGAIFHGALQLGSAVGLAAVTSIEVSVEKKFGFDEYRGRAAAFLFLLGIVVMQTIGVLVFYRNRSTMSASISSDAGVGFDTVLNDEKFAAEVQDSRDFLGDVEIDLTTLRV